MKTSQHPDTFFLRNKPTDRKQSDGGTKAESEALMQKQQGAKRLFVASPCGRSLTRRQLSRETRHDVHRLPARSDTGTLFFLLTQSRSAGQGGGGGVKAPCRSRKHSSKEEWVCLESPRVRLVLVLAAEPVGQRGGDASTAEPMSLSNTTF